MEFSVWGEGGAVFLRNFTLRVWSIMWLATVLAREAEGIYSSATSFTTPLVSYGPKCHETSNARSSTTLSNPNNYFVLSFYSPFIYLYCKQTLFSRSRWANLRRPINGIPKPSDHFRQRELLHVLQLAYLSSYIVSGNDVKTKIHLRTFEIHDRL